MSTRDDQQVELLQKIERGVRSNWYINFWRGIWGGAGFIAGSVLAIALLGWVLSLFGLIPGIGSIAHTLESIVRQSSVRP